jgi:transposase
MAGGFDGERAAMMRSTGDMNNYLYRKLVDMRRGRHGLAALAREAMQIDAFSNALLIFVGGAFDTLKVWH